MAKSLETPHVMYDHQSLANSQAFLLENVLMVSD